MLVTRQASLEVGGQERSGSLSQKEQDLSLGRGSTTGAFWDGGAWGTSGRPWVSVFSALLSFPLIPVTLSRKY